MLPRSFATGSARLPLVPLTLLDHTGQPFEDDAFLAMPLTATDAQPDRTGHGALACPRMVPLLAALAQRGRPAIHVAASDRVHRRSRQGARTSFAPLINPLTLVEPENPAPTLARLKLLLDSRNSASSALAQIRRKLTPAHRKLQQQFVQLLQSTQNPIVQPRQPRCRRPSLHPRRNPGQSLIAAHDEIYYRAKAAAVLFMLRSITGDAALKQALQLYRDEVRHADAATPEDPRAFQRVLEAASHKDLA